MMRQQRGVTLQTVGNNGWALQVEQSGYWETDIEVSLYVRLHIESHDEQSIASFQVRDSNSFAPGSANPWREPVTHEDWRAIAYDLAHSAILTPLGLLNVAWAPVEEDEPEEEGEFWAAVMAERLRQAEEWGGPDHDANHEDDTWLTILSKQIGHVANAVLRQKKAYDRTEDQKWRDNLRDELVQVAAVAAAWAEQLA